MSLEDGKVDNLRALGAIPSHEKWGPYVAERGWGLVREDYSADGDAWNFFPHDHARSRAYRRVEDGIAGISDRFQVLLLAPCFWNGKDPILKERLFGLSSYEGNHGEDVKEIYYYLDALPDHSYLKYLYKYPQNAFPYDLLVKENKNRNAKDREFELIDTKIFDDDAYFDIFIEYAKVHDEDFCVRIEAINRGRVSAPIYILPQLWFRNQWSWDLEKKSEPIIKMGKSKNGCICLEADDSNIASPPYLLFDYHLGKRYLYTEDTAEALFTNNETNEERLFQKPNKSDFVKDGIEEYLIRGLNTVNSEKFGTKAALKHFFPSVDAGKSVVVKLRFSPVELEDPLKDFDFLIENRRKSADRFYEALHPLKATNEEKKIQRQALSGLIWSKQFYYYDVGAWIEGDKKNPPPIEHRTIRNYRWRHMVSLRVFSMPDKWEYPWFAAWDLTFHALSFLLVDIEFAKYQLWLLLFDQFQHPNGAIPAYEWEFSDVNPPVQAWAVLQIYYYEKKKKGVEDFAYLEKCFHKLLLNFAWWVNKIDHEGNNVFEGGFLGMDNISILDRSENLGPGTVLDQADGAGWISMLCLNLTRIALILAKKNPTYEGLGIKFFHHFVYVTAAMRKSYWRKYDLWDDEDGFFYSYLHKADGSFTKIPVRSLVGVIPFLATDVWDEQELKEYKEFYAAFEWLLSKRSHLTDVCVQKKETNSGTKFVFGVMKFSEMEKFLKVLFSVDEFLSPFGIRSLSKFHEKNPVFLDGFSIHYEPGESEEKIKGGNSNWRGPVWFPMNYLVIDALNKLDTAFNHNLSFEDSLKNQYNFGQMAEVISQSLINLFRKDKANNRPFLGDVEKFQKDPLFSENFFFYEHFHGDTGRGLGALHQTGWTALVAKLIEEIYEKKPD